MLFDMTSLQRVKACGLTQASIVVTTEVCSYVILKDVSILLIVVIAFPSILVPIIEVSMNSSFF